MSDGLVKRAREVATEARDDFAQYWFDAEETGERPDLILIEANVPVEWIEHMADRIEELEAKLAIAVQALGEIATDEHPLGWIAITALTEISGGGDT